MGMKIQATAMVTYTCELSDEDIPKIKDFIDFRREERMGGEEYEEYQEEEILDAIRELSSDCEIDLCKDSVESDFMTDEIRWSEYEDREPQEIMGSI